MRNFFVLETERQNEELKVKFQQVQEDLSACSEIQKGRKCEEGWISHDLKCYYFSTFKLNWTRSRDECVGKGGHLVIITSRAEQNFVSSQIVKTHWIGLNDLETEGKWVWVNNQETSVTFWYRSPKGIDEPDNWTKEDPSGENCVALGNDEGGTNKWFDASCRKQKQFICEN
ncbi:immune-related, lectin-like receptor 2 [Silurus meridionalis]|nr:immune-related, lectin-like receptor 2 [Silurus meridionalis]